METWISSGEKDNIVHGELLPSGYSLIDVPHVKGMGCVIGVVYISLL